MPEVQVDPTDDEELLRVNRVALNGEGSILRDAKWRVAKRSDMLEALRFSVVPG
jgi:hypothetical protein